jgi:hypothetical protein
MGRALKMSEDQYRRPLTAEERKLLQDAVGFLPQEYDDGVD